MYAKIYNNELIYPKENLSTLSILSQGFKELFIRNKPEDYTEEKYYTIPADFGEWIILQYYPRK